MSLLALDFPSGQTGLYGTNKSYMLNGIYAQADSDVTIVDDPDANITGNVLRFFPNTDSTSPYLDGMLRRVLPAAITTVGVAFRVYFGTLPPNSSAYPQILLIMDQVSTVHLSFRVLPTGAIAVNRGPYPSGTLLGTTSPAIVTGAWQHIEVKATINDTTGSVEIRVEGVPVLTLTGVDTCNGANVHADQIAHCNTDTGSGTTYYLKDIVIWDTAGSVNNNFFGSVSVYELIPNGDTALTWSLSSGSTGYTLVDEAPPNDDTDYIYAVSPPPAADKMSLTDLPVDVTSVRGLITIVRSKKTDGGDGNLQIGMVSGASTALGSDRPITTAYTYWQDVFELDPATSTAWTRVSVNASNIQFNRTL